VTTTVTGLMALLTYREYFTPAHQRQLFLVAAD
jgi:hypothetical protein